jgi:hypothetical protein
MHNVMLTNNRRYIVKQQVPCKVTIAAMERNNFSPQSGSKFSRESLNVTLVQILWLILLIRMKHNGHKV